MNPQEYFNAIARQWEDRLSTEHSYRRFLQDFLETNSADISALNEPRRTVCGAPDYIVTRRGILLGYVEAKDVGADLIEAEETEQLLRYRAAFPNLILTNYIEFRWYVDGQLRDEARLGVLTRNLRRLDATGADRVLGMIRAFFSFITETIRAAPEFASRLASTAQVIRRTIALAFVDEERRQEHGQLHDLFGAFRRVLIHDLSSEQFADMYAQTVAYGMFAAAVNHAGDERFTRIAATYDLPRTNPFLRRLFGTIAGPDLDNRVAWIVDDLAESLERTDIQAVLQGFGEGNARTDPVIHFYETFLRHYDPELRVARGVYYTPEQVVRFIVRCVHQALQDNFRITQGLADWSRIGNDGIHRVQILDPATGTGTFLREVIATVYNEFSDNLGMWPGYVSSHLLPRIHGFELLMAPYAIAHMKLGLALTDTGYHFETDERLKVFLTNTLEDSHFEGDAPLFTRWLTEEAGSAANVKREVPVMVILGNPPYSRASYNQGAWIEGLMEEYKRTVRAEESQIQGLSNDYIKFVRFAQWKLESVEQGILGYITGHGFLNGPQARDMRESLLRTFCKIHILNLHGSARREVTTGVERDEPVFQIQQGTSIIIAIRGALPDGRDRCEVLYAEMFGPVNSKFERLEAGDLRTLEWTELDPREPDFFFTPRTANPAYETYWSIPEIFGTGDRQADREQRWATGFASQQDDFAISFSDDEVHAKVNLLVQSADFAEARQSFRLCSTNQWNYDSAKDYLRGNLYEIQTCRFRPFDNRRTIFSRHVVSILRERVMAQLDHENVALVVSRVANDSRFAHVFVTDGRTDKIFLSSSTSTNAYIFPLYVYSSDTLNNLFGIGQVKIPNLSERCVREWARLIDLPFIDHGEGDRRTNFGPEDVLFYIYSVLHSTTYRELNDADLRRDFPRIPAPKHRELFIALCEQGRSLVNAHLLRAVGDLQTRYPSPGSNRVERVRFEREGQSGAGRVWVNRDQSFTNISELAWNFRVGKYYPIRKWLTERRDRVLQFEDIEHYRRVSWAIHHTINSISEIDAIIEDAGGLV